MSASDEPATPVTVEAALAPLLRFDLEAFAGLPRTSVATLVALWGTPASEDQVTLGWFPARRYTFPRPGSGGLVAYVRDGEVVAVDTMVPPPLSAMDRLGDPSAILPHELLAPDAYVHEYLYAPRGLVLSVAEPFAAGGEARILRSRGVRPMASAKEYGPAFHRSIDDEEVY